MFYKRIIAFILLGAVSTHVRLYTINAANCREQNVTHTYKHTNTHTHTHTNTNTSRDIRAHTRRMSNLIDISLFDAAPLRSEKLGFTFEETSVVTISDVDQVYYSEQRDATDESTFVFGTPPVVSPIHCNALD